MRFTKLKSDKGFTIVELMIALSILSVLLITSTIVLIQIGALYSKGVNAADLQNATRKVVADLSAQLQFSGKVPNSCTPIVTTCYADTDNFGSGGGAETVYSYCINNTRYSYVINRELGGDTTTTPAQTTPHVLWRDTLKTDSTTCDALDITQANPSDASTKPGSGYEMMGNHMRLTRFKVQQTSDSSNYSIQLWTAFGDSDLVRSSDPNAAPTCASGAGTQFCSTATISTQLTGRVY